MPQLASTHRISGGALTPPQTAFFHTEGYVIVENVFEPEDLDPIRDDLKSEIDRKVNQLSLQEVISDVHGDESFERRLARIYQDDPRVGLDILRHLEGASGGGFHGRSIFDLITHQKLLEVVSTLVGEEIVASSAYRIRPKLQGSSRGDIPWHQDSGYFANHCDDHLILTCWIPLVDATAENGCMEILPRSHKSGILEHHSGGNSGLLVITDDDLPESAPERVTAACPLGGVVFMSNLTAHCSTPNYSDTTRWSVDIRYQSRHTPTNADLWPNRSLADLETNESLACYPPEADFVVQSRQTPESVVDFEGFKERRKSFEDIVVGAPRTWPAI